MSKSFRSNSEETFVQHRPRSRKVRDELDENFSLDSAGVSDDDAEFIRRIVKKSSAVIRKK